MLYVERELEMRREFILFSNEPIGHFVNYNEKSSSLHPVTNHHGLFLRSLNDLEIDQTDVLCLCGFVCGSKN